MVDQTIKNKLDCARYLTELINRIDKPMLMFQIEKDVVKEALNLYIKTLNMEVK